MGESIDEVVEGAEGERLVDGDAVVERMGMMVGGGGGPATDMLTVAALEGDQAVVFSVQVSRFSSNDPA